MSNQVPLEQFELLDRMLVESPASVADMGAGSGHHARRFLEAGLSVLAIDRVITAELAEVVNTHPGRCRFLGSDVSHLPVADDSLDAIWASHCLEHMEDMMSVLAEWRRVLKPEGLLAVLVPPYKSEIVGRHLTTGWNVGQLMLTLFRARFRVWDGVYARHGWNVFAMVRKCERMPMFKPNDETLFQYHEHFPPVVEQEILDRKFTNSFGETVGRFEGNIDRIGW